MIKAKNASNRSAGYSLIEISVIISIVGILSSIALVNLSSTWRKSQLQTTARELKNWLSEQRSYAKTNNITCLITIDQTDKRLISTKYPGQNDLPCRGKSDSGDDFFDLATNFGNENEKISLISTPSTDPDHSDGGILFSLQGFSQNHQLRSTGILEIRISHSNLQQQRCIRIISPIGMIRDGRTEGNDPQCRYDKTN